MATREEWADRVRRWRNSKLKGIEFAEKEGINKQTLYQWASRLKHAGGDAEPARFVEVALPQVQGSGVEIALRDSATIRVEREFDGDTLRRVIAILESR